jgi:hypothetical protein
MYIARRMSGIVTGVAVCLLLASAGIAHAGSLDSPGAPGVTGSYTLEDIYSRLNSGTAGTPGAFTEPTAGPTAGTMHTLNDIMGKAPVEDDANGASVADVLAGKTFWGLTSGGWGPRIGTLSTRTVSNSTVSQDAGYYGAFNLSAVDTDLAAGNIKKDVNIFGVVGTYGGEGELASVPKTGQTPTIPMDPAPAGSDGALQKGVAWPNPRFTDNGNGTVTDNLTGLIWLKNANTFGQRNWATALTDCAALKSGDYGLNDGSVAGDWRLPNIRELFSLIDFRWTLPALCNTAGNAKWTEGEPFTGVQSGYYWSSTTHAYYTDSAWCVILQGGVVNSGSKTAYLDYVWPVRGGQQ